MHGILLIHIHSNKISKYDQKKVCMNECMYVGVGVWCVSEEVLEVMHVLTIGIVII